MDGEQLHEGAAAAGDRVLVLIDLLFVPFSYLAVGPAVAARASATATSVSPRTP